MTEAEELVHQLLEDDKPPYSVGVSDQEREQASSKSPFHAMHYAVNIDKRHHPRTWAAVKGSPYEAHYRRRFNVKS